MLTVSLQVRDNNQVCHKFDDLIKVNDSINFPNIRYHRIKATLTANVTGHVLQDNGTLRFYRSGGVDLEDVSEIWKTGWGRCSCSGSVVPRLDSEIVVNC